MMDLYRTLWETSFDPKRGHDRTLNEYFVFDRLITSEDDWVITPNNDTIYLRAFLDLRAANAALLAAQILTVTAETHSDQHTWFFGARWDVREDLAVKAQIDLIKGSPTSLFPFRGDNNAWDGDMTVFSLALDFVF